ncbi:MAG: InlB B-repeat-containing protein, partial [Clostridia bacterium]|nr:InlB B-repeat-containing protein [Clostridia bacterium]
MKNKKLAVLLSALVLTTAPVAVLATACDTTPENPPVDQTTEYTFSFVGGEGATGSAPASIKKKSEETFTLPANTFAKDGYTFEGWSDGTATTPFAAGATYTAGTANVTFTAVWKAVDYKVSFVGGEGATGTVADITGK